MENERRSYVTNLQIPHYMDFIVKPMAQYKVPTY
jgi:hypothetical protein